MEDKLLQKIIEDKDRYVSELSEEVSKYLKTITDGLRRGEIKIDEISGYLKDNLENIKPGTVGQILQGCISEKSCILTKTENKSSSFIYDGDKLNLLIKDGMDLAIVFIEGDPDNIDLDSLKDLERKGFKSIRIEYKMVGDNDYSSVEYDLKKYISLKDNRSNIIGLIIVLIAVIIFGYAKFSS